MPDFRLTSIIGLFHALGKISTETLDSLMVVEFRHRCHFVQDISSQELSREDSNQSDANGFIGQGMLAQSPVEDSHIEMKAGWEPIDK